MNAGTEREMRKERACINVWTEQSAERETNLDSQLKALKGAFKTFCFQVTGKLNQRTQNKSEKRQESISMVEEFYLK